jgi:hypothetical protein
MTAVAVIHVKQEFVPTNEPRDMKWHRTNGFESPRTRFRLLIEFEWYYLISCPLLSISISIIICGITTITVSTVASTGGSSTTKSVWVPRNLAIPYRLQQRNTSV